MYLSKIYIIKSIGNYAGKLLTEIISKELFYVHNRGVIFTREPTAATSDLFVSEVATVASRCLSFCAVVLPKSVFEEGLRQAYLKEPPVGTDRQDYG